MIRYLLSILQSIPKKAGYKKFLGENYEEFMEMFAEQYRKFIKDKDVVGLKKFKDEVGTNKFGKLQKHAKTNNFITKFDTDAAKAVSSKGSIQQSNILFHLNYFQK